jgi:hypothetical protein
LFLWFTDDLTQIDLEEGSGLERAPEEHTPEEPKELEACELVEAEVDTGKALEEFISSQG